MIKRILTAMWNFLEEWGEYRYKIAKKNGYNLY